MEEGLYPFYVRSQEPLRKNEYEFDETAIVTAGDGVGVGKVFHYVEGKYALHQRAYRIHITNPEVLPRYCFHYMRSSFLQYIQKTMFHGSVSSIRRPMLNAFPVPVPPLSVQKRLITVLDNFDTICSNLDIGLPAEIEARQKQYEYYRDLLLTFVESGTAVATDRQTDRQDDIKILQYVFGYAFCEVKDVISSLKTGLNPRKNFKLNDGGKIPYITGKDIYNNCYNVTERTDLIKEVDLQLINKRAELTSDMILFASTGTGTVGRMAYVDKYNNDWGISETLYAIKTNESLIDPLFLMYSLYSSQAKQQFEPKISKGSVPHLKIADLLKVRISVPTLEKQKEIIKIIRSFDILCDDITEGLPAEIEARQKQYEYYRDKLLTFKGKN